MHPCIRDLGATLVVQFADGSAMKLPRCCIDADGASQCAGHGGVDGGREPADSRRKALAAATERREYPSLGGQELGERTWAAPLGDRRDAMFWEVSALRRARARTGSGVLPRTFAASPPPTDSVSPVPRAARALRRSECVNGNETPGCRM